MNDSHKCLEFRDGSEANSERVKTPTLGPGALTFGTQDRKTQVNQVT